MAVKTITGDQAVAYGAMLARAEVVPGFPITPQTVIIEQISEFINDGLMDADFIPAESEHSVMSVAVGASAGGVRTFTATSSQGLALMYEMLFAAAPTRLPVVMAVANRSLGAASGIWTEHNDSVPVRESGWLQVYVEDNQEALDMIIQAFRIAEDRRVMLPIMVCLDGFILSHVVEGVDIPEQAVVDRFLPRFAPVNVLDPRDPIMMNPVTPPEFATELRYQQDRAVEAARTVIGEADEEFAALTGRRYGGLFEAYRLEDAEFALIGLGTWAGIAREVVDQLRAEGKKAGLIKLRYMRPFPGQELRQATLNLKALGTFDRSAAFNGYGPVFTEVRNALYGSGITVTDHLAGIGGRDITAEMVRDMYGLVERSARGEKVRDCTWHALRGEME
ncbi:MAG: pyruvate ferredoxin oxidoreductase [Methanomassiliicoccus sp.]|nr:pyruvate ferredoxin oxidoreductase [Methanomassiliicoccus sp.]